MRLPKVAGVLSDSTKLAWHDLDSTVAKLIYQAVITEDFANLNAWTETDADAKVNLSGGVITMDGGATTNSHGLYYTSGISAAEGYLEIKAIIPAVANGAIFGISNSAALAWATAAGVPCIYTNSLTFDAYANTGQVIAKAFPVTASTYYTLRIYINKAYDGSWKAVKFTVQGGAQYTTETDVVLCGFLVTAIASTFYPQIQRYASSGANLNSFKEFRWYSGFATDGPYTTYTHDAGSGKTFDNFDMTSLVMPGSMVSTNLKFDYYFGDDSGGALSGTWRTLAQLNALGKVSERHRYIKIAVQNNSDGATQAYGAKPNSDTATDGCGDFPALSKLMADDTCQGASGTLALSNVSAAAGGTMSGVTGFSSVRFSLAGAVEVTATGYGFTGKTAATVGGTACTGLVVDSDTQMRFTVPAKAAGSYAFAATGGTNAEISMDKAFEYDDKLYSATEEAARNKFQTGSSASDILSGKGVVFAGVDVDGTSDKIYSAVEYAIQYLIDEAVRNTDMLAAKVENLYAYVTRGISRIGSLVSGGSLTAPTAPTITAVATSKTNIRISWASVPELSQDMKIYRSGVLIGTVSVASAEYFDDSARTPNTTYSYTAKASNDAGDSDASASVSATTMSGTASARTLCTTPLASIVALTGIPTLFESANGTFFDARLFESVISEDAFEYYFKDVTTNDGLKVVPRQ